MERQSEREREKTAILLMGAYIDFELSVRV